jgi:hypothetical protein
VRQGTFREPAAGSSVAGATRDIGSGPSPEDNRDLKGPDTTIEQGRVAVLTPRADDSHSPP